jgi:hypothetical protein
MLITLRHLLVMILLLTMGLLGGIPAIKWAGLGEGISLLLCVLSSILVFALLGWPAFKLLSLRPLILPTCPSCGQRHANYHIPRDAWPAAIIVCVHCSKPLRLALSRGARSMSPDLPTVTLCWPGFLGLWSRGPLKESNAEVRQSKAQ